LNAIGTTLRRAAGLAVATCVVALVLAAALAGEAAERFATTAYLAAIFLVLVLVAGRFVGERTPAPRSGPSAAFPSFLGYSLLVVIFLSVGAGLVSQPDGEALAMTGCIALIGVAALVRCGALAAFNAALARGGVLVAAARYTVLLGVCALAITALAGGDETVAVVAYRFMVLVACLLSGVLLAPTRAGIWLKRGFQRFVSKLDALADAFVFERAALYAGLAAIAAMLVASVLPVPVSEPFAIVAYFAAVAAAVGIVMECRRLRS
jgi:hypothetical protein